MAQRYRSRAEWTTLVAELESSELTVAEFARRRKLSESRLQRWRSKLRRESQEQPSAVPFVEVVQAASAPQQAAAWLEVGGVVVRFGSLPTPGYLGKVAQALARKRQC